MKKKTTADYWKAIDILHPTHRMAGQWHDIYKGTKAYCNDQAPSGWGNFGCNRCNAIVMLEKRGKKLWPRQQISVRSSKKVECPYCYGHGRIVIDGDVREWRECDMCNGKGEGIRI